MVEIVVKTKSLLPSLKEKKRYVVFEVFSKKTSLETAKKEIMSKAKELYGLYGLSRMNLRFLSDWNNNRGIVKVNNKYVNHLRGCFVLGDLGIKTVNISGILKKARRVI